MDFLQQVGAYFDSIIAQIEALLAEIEAFFAGLMPEDAEEV